MGSGRLRGHVPLNPSPDPLDRRSLMFFASLPLEKVGEQQCTLPPLSSLQAPVETLLQTGVAHQEGGIKTVLELLAGPGLQVARVEAGLPPETALSARAWGNLGREGPHHYGQCRVGGARATKTVLFFPEMGCGDSSQHGKSPPFQPFFFVKGRVFGGHF